MSDIRSPTSIHPALTKPDNLPLFLETIDEAAPQAKLHSPTKQNGTSVGDSLLREYAQQLGPLNTSSKHSDHFDNGPPESSFSAATTVGENSPRTPLSQPATPSFPSKAPAQFQAHRRNALSVESIPQQT